MECNVSDEHHLLEQAIIVTCFVCSMLFILCVIYLKKKMNEYSFCSLFPPHFYSQMKINMNAQTCDSSLQVEQRMWSQMLTQHVLHIQTVPAVSGWNQELKTWPCTRSHFCRRAACVQQQLQRHIPSPQNVLSCFWQMLHQCLCLAGFWFANFALCYCCELCACVDWSAVWCGLIISHGTKDFLYWCKSRKRHMVSYGLNDFSPIL